jgi:hypothetical protein
MEAGRTPPPAPPPAGTPERTGPVREASVVPGRIGAALIVLAAATLLLSFLFLDYVDYTQTYSNNDPFGPELAPGDVGYEAPDVFDKQFKGKDIADEETDGAAILVWTIAAGGFALIVGLVGLIPAVARRIWVVALPLAVVAAAWCIYSATWFNDEYEDLSRMGPGGKISLIAGIVIVVVAIVASIVVAMRNRRTAL